MEQRQMRTELGLDGFLDDPSAYFGHSLTRIMSNSRADIDELQLAGLNRRFTPCTMLEMDPENSLTRHLSVAYWKGGDYVL
jgi:hypothetical protein